MKTKRFVLLAFFVAIEIVLANTPLGFVPIGALRATTLHIPVILAGLLMGKREGLIMGFVFGMCSFITATFTPTLTSFVFSPFYAQGNMFSLLICFGPRLLLGYLSGLVGQRKGSYGLFGALLTLIHTALVLTGIYVFFHDAYASVIGTQGLGLFLLGIVFTNGISEAILASIMIAILYKPLKKIMARGGFDE
ncbi:MAG: ECF transporter S component [Erysipelotrichaceae bacterium]|nr:ECF transporter S component [Erysipelotrichaceae bacterium]MDY5252070.1 ECF transporter S component [Erysipelotrichaceae bacterium]